MSDDAPGLVVSLGIDTKPLDASTKDALAKTDAFTQANEAKHKSSLGRLERMYDKLKLNNDLNVARASGDNARIRELQDELELNQKIAEFKRAKKPDNTRYNNESARAEAQAYMDNLRAARAAKEAADAEQMRRQAALAAEQRAFQLEQVALEERLQVARALGDKVQIRALEEELVLNQAIARYRSLGLGGAEAKASAEAYVNALGAAEAARVAAGTLSRQELMELGHVARSSFDALASGASPLRVLETEGARVAQALGETPGGVGAALRGLVGAINPMTAGLAAGAVALGVTALALERVHKAAEDVGELKLASDKVGVPVEELQEWQFVATASHVSNQQLNESFMGLNETLGKLKSGIRDARVKPFIEELGITDEEIAKARTAADFLDLIMSKIGKIADPSERIQIAQAFGITQLLPILGKTKDDVDDLKDVFRKAGVVISDEFATAIKKQNEELDEAHALIKDKIQADLVQLAPTVNGLALAWDKLKESVLGAMAAMATAGQKKPPEAPSQHMGLLLGALFGESTPGLVSAGLYDGMAYGARQTPTPAKGKPAPQPAPPTSAQNNAADAAAQEAQDALDKINHISRVTKEAQNIAHENAALTAAGRAPLSADDINRRIAAAQTEDAKSGVAAGKKAVDETEASNKAISDAKKAQLKALIAVTADLAQDHALKLQELRDERDEKDSKAKLDAQKGDISAAARDQAIGFNTQAYDLGVQEENRKYAMAVADQARTYQNELLKFQIEHLTAQAAIATTAQAWAAEQQEAFVKQQALDRTDFVAKTNKRTFELGENHLSPEQAQAEIAGFDARQADESAAKTKAIQLEVLDKRLAFANALQSYQEATLQAEAGVAATAAQRREIEAKILAMRQQAELDAFNRARLANTENESPDQWNQRLAALQTKQTAETAAQAKKSEGPLAGWASSMGDVNTEVQTGLVSGLNSLNSGLAAAIVHSKDLGQAFHEAALSMVEDLIKIGLQQGELAIMGQGGNVFSALLGGAAGAASGAAGGGNIALAPSADPLAAAVAGAPLIASGLGGLFGAAAGGAGATAAGLSLTPAVDPLQAAIAGAQPLGGATLGTPSVLDTALQNTGLNPAGTGDLNIVGQGISAAGAFAKLFGLFGFQDGTLDAPGGPALVGEDGPEIVDLPAGAQVHTNTQLNAMQSIRPQDTTRQSPAPVAYFDLRGAVMTEDLLRQANAHASAISQSYATQAFHAARAVIPNDLRQSQRGQFR